MKEISFKTIRAKCLYKFLYKHNLLARYLSNLIEQYPSSKGVPEFLKDKDFLKLLEKTLNIDSSFTWSETEEGHTFWRELNQKEIDETHLLLDDLRLVGVKIS